MCKLYVPPDFFGIIAWYKCTLDKHDNFFVVGVIVVASVRQFVILVVVVVSSSSSSLSLLSSELSMDKRS